MYQGNPLIRKVGEQIDYEPWMIEEVVKCSQDIIYFAEKYFTIVTIDEGKQLIKLYDFQKKMLKAFVSTPNGKRHCIVKIARQSGKTTISSIFLLWYALFNKDKTVAILANKEAIAIEILDRIKMALKNLPLWMQVGVQDGGWNQKAVSLGNGTKLIAAGTSSDSISGLTVSLLYMDEFAKVPKSVADNFITATYPVISSGKTSKIIIVSTPTGMNHFYEFWSRAVKGKSNFFPIKVAWWEVPGRDQQWKKEMIADIGPNRFAQEFQCKFLGSNSLLIDSDILELMDGSDPIDTKWTGLLQIYEHPIRGKSYILGVDTAKGTGRDSSVIQVLKINGEYDIEQVAVYRNNQIIPREFAQVVISISDYYNQSLIMAENNDIGQALCDAIFYDYECERLLNLDPKGIGIRSTKTTKLIGNMLLKDYAEKKYLKIVDARTIYELSKYEEVSTNVFAADNENDDCVTSLIWALYFIKTDYFDGKHTYADEIEDKYKIEEDTFDVEDTPVIIFDEN